MKFGKRLLTCLALSVITVISLGVFAACQDVNGGNGGNGGNSSSNAITWAGEYYYDAADNTEWTVSIKKDGTFAINMGEGTVTGSYTYDGKSLAFGNADYSASYDATNRAVTVTYNGQTYRFVEKIEYTVTYATNGGTSVPASKVVNGKTLSKPADPEFPGKNFVGWYKDAGFNNAFGFDSEPVTGDITLYARFVDKEEGSSEYTVSFDLNGKNGSAPAPLKTIGGVAFDLPTPKVAGETFVGWYYSEYNSPEKLAGKYEDQVLTEDTTLYAVWASDGLTVSVDKNAVTWTSVGVNARYSIVVLNTTTGKSWARSNINTLKQSYTFTDAGEYEVTVTSTNGSAATAYYKYHVLKPTTIAVIDNSLTYTAVDDATNYRVSVECGTAGHVHTDFDNGTSLYYDFTACDMKPDGIKFTVTASADGYLSSTATYTLVRTLDQVTGIAVGSDAVATWNAVDNATGYLLTVNYKGKTENFTLGANACSYDLKNYGAGDLKLTVKATAHGYNSSEDAAYTYAKTTLAAPQNLTFEGEEITWDAVENAVSYNVNIDGTDYNVQGTVFTLNNDVIVGGQTDYVVKVQAVAAQAANNSLFGEARTLSYKFETVKYADGKLSWTAYAGATFYKVYLNGVNVSLTMADEYVFTFDKAGENTVGVTYVAKNGFESEMLTDTVTTYEIVLDTDGGIEVDEEGNDVTATSAFYAIGDAIRLSTTLYKRGYSFVGWYNVKGGAANMGIEFTDTVYQTNPGTLYASWLANTYKATLHFSDNTTAEVPVTYDQPYTFAVDTNDSVLYAFAGWYTDLNGRGSKYADETGASASAWKLPQDLDLYPYWPNVFEFTQITRNNVAGYAVEKSSGIIFIPEVTIPAEYNGKPVLEIASSGFKNTPTLKVLNIPDSIEDCTEITAFDDCTALTAINVYEVNGNHERVYGSNDGILFKNNIYNGVEMVYAPLGKTGELVIPSHVTFNGATMAVTTLPVNAFKNSSLSKITIPYTIQAIQLGCFESAANLEEIVFEATPAGEEMTPLAISEGAFKSLTSLTTLTLPERMTEFNTKVIASCANLKYINVAGEGGKYSSVGGLLTNGAKTTIVYVPAAYAGANDDGKFTVPEGVTSIGANAFSANTGVTDVTIPGWVTYIGKEAFAKRSTSDVLTSNTTIKSLTFAGTKENPDLTIDEYAFYYLNQIATLTIPENCKTIGAHAFGYTTALTTVDVESCGEVDFKERAFANMPTSGTTALTYYVTHLNIGKEVGAFEISGVFGPTKLETIIIHPENPNFVADEKSIVYDKEQTRLLFVPMSLEGEYTTPDSLMSIGAGAFNARTGLTKVTIGYNVAEIGTDAFVGCTGLTDVIFEATPAGETPVELTIGSAAFRGCTQLSSMTFPERLTELGSTMFFGDLALTSVSLPSTLTKINEGYELVTISSEQVEFRYTDAFVIAASRTTPTLATITVAEGNTKYKAINNALYALNENGDPVRLLTVAQAYAGEDGKLTVPATVTSIGTRAMYYGNVTELQFAAEEVEDLSIDAYAFYYASVASVKLPAGTKEIGPRSFYYANLLQKINVPYTVTSIGYNAFYYCSVLTELDFDPTPADKTPVALRIEDAKLPGSTASDSSSYSVFYYCNALPEVILPERTTYIGSYAFYYIVYQKLAKVVIPSTVTEIGSHAFYYTSTGVLNDVTFATRTETVNNEQVQVSDLKVIGEYAFYYSSMTTANLPDSVEEIGKYAFYYNRSLSSIHMPANLKKIGERAFYYCSALTLIELPDKLETIDLYAFYDCTALREVTVPASVKSIGNYAFAYMTALKKINFATDPETGLASLQTMGTYCFASSGLTEFTFPETANEIIVGDGTNKKIFNNCKSITKVTLSTKTSDLSDMFYGCTSIREFEVPDENPNFSELEGYPLLMNHDKSVVKLCVSINGAFTLPEGIKAIDADAFNGMTGLTQITLPSTLIRIGKQAFRGCTALTEVIFKTGENGASALSEIDGYAFYGCSNLVTMKFPASSNIETLSEYVLYNCSKLENFVMPAGIKRIENRALYNCTSLILKTLPSSVNFIGGYALYKVGLVSATLSGDIELETYAFDYAQELANLTILEGVTEIPANCFYYCTALKSITLPSTLETIGNVAFGYCTSLEEVNFTKNAQGSYSLTKVGYELFYHTDSLKSITMPGTIKYVVGSAATTANSSAALFYYSGVEEVTFEEGTNLIPAYAFAYTTNLKKVNMPATVTEIGPYAFMKCPIEEVTIPYSVTKIGNYAFSARSSTSDTSNVTALKKVTFEETPDGALPVALNLGSTTYLFYYATELEEVTFPDRLVFKNAAGTANSTTSLYTFYYSGVKKVTLPDTLDYIPAYFFYYSQDLETVNMPSALKEIGNYAFYHCDAIETIALPGNVTKIGNYAFAYTTNLKEMTFPASFKVTGATTSTYLLYYSGVEKVTIQGDWTAIPNYFLNNCKNLTEFTIPSSVTTLGNYVFAYTTALKEMTIPSTVKAITAVGTSTNMFQYSGVEKVTIEGAWTAIPNYMFSHATELKEFTIPSTVKTLGNYAFEYTTSLTDIELPTGLSAVTSATASAQYLFRYSGVKMTTLPANWTAIPTGFFYGSDMEEFTVPANIKTIGNYAFAYTTKLKEIVLPETLNAVTSISNSTYMFYYSNVEKVTLPSKWTVIPNYTFGYTSNLKSVVVGDKLTAIGNDVFYHSGIKGDFTIPTGVKTIGTYAFEYAELDSVTVPNTVTEIGNYSFAYMPNLEKITFDDNFTSLKLGYYMFYQSPKLKTVENFPENTTSPVLGTSASTTNGLGYMFYGTAIEEFTIPSEWTVIPYGMFYGDVALKSVTIPASITAIGTYAFYNCTALEEVKAEARTDGSTVTMGGSVFSGCTSLTKQNLSQYMKVNSVGTSATTDNGYMFTGTAIEEITIPDSWTVIPYAFLDGNEAIKSITIPAKVTEIGTYAFRNCSNLENVEFEQGSKLTTVGGSVFMGTTSLKGIDLPTGLTITAVGSGSTTGGKDAGASMFFNSGIEEITLPKNVSVLTAQMFSGCENLKKVTVKGDLTTTYTTYYQNYSTESYRAYATFYNCTALEEVVFEGEVTIGANLFRGFNFEDKTPWTVTFKGDVISLGNLVFTETNGLTEITFMGNVGTVGAGAISENYDLEKITFAGDIGLLGSGSVTYTAPDGSSYTGGLAVAGNPKLTEIVFGGNVDTIGDMAFAANPLIKNFTFNNVLSMGDYAFAYNDALESVTYDSVVSFGNYCFAYDKNITSFTFPENYVITSAYDGEGMLRGTGITSLTLPAGVTVIPNYFVAECEDLKSLTYLGTITEIGRDAFYSTKLGDFTEKFTIPESVTTIGIEAFNDSGLTELTISKNVTSIGYGAFAWCYFDKFEVAADNPVYKLDDVGNLIDRKTRHVLMVPCSTTGEYTMANGYTYDRQAFHGSLITKLIVPDGVVDIDDYMFFDMPEVTEIVLPSTVRSIGQYAFSSCNKLKTIVLPEGLETIAKRAFWSCKGLESVTIPSTVTEIGEYAFSRTGLKSITIPDTVQSFGQYVFWQCYDLESAVFSGSRTSIDGPTTTTNLNMFHSCSSLESVTLPADLTTARGLFGYLDSDRLVITEGLKAIAPYMFYYCYANEIVIPESVHEYGTYAFAYAEAKNDDAENPTSRITIKGNVEKSNTNTFYHTAYDTIEFAEGVTSIDTTSTGTTSSYGLMYYGYMNNVIFPSTLTTLNAPYMMYYGTEKEIDLSKTKITAIPTYFAYTSSTANNPLYQTLTSLTMPDTVTSIGNYAFYYQKHLTSVTLPAGVEHLGQYSFAYTGVEEVYIPSSVTSAGTYSFAYCLNIKKITYAGRLPADKSTYMFYVSSSNASSVTEIVVEEGVTAIPIDNFYYAVRGEWCTVTLPSTLKDIGNYGFGNCTTIKDIVIPASVESIGNYAFNGWTADSTIYFETTEDKAPTLGTTALSASVNVVWGSKGPVYLDTSMWNDENADERYAAYFYRTVDGQTEFVWVDMVEAGDDLYVAAVPMGYETVVFVRMDGATIENNWDNKWNQTNDLSTNGYIGKTFTVTQWGENGAPSTGEWN